MTHRVARRARRFRRREHLLRGDRRRRRRPPRTIVLTHGAGGSHAAWYQQVPVLAAAGYRVVTWDSRGFGLSTFTSGECSVPTRPSPTWSPYSTRSGSSAPTSSASRWAAGGSPRSRSPVPSGTISLTLSNTVGGLWTDALGEHFRRFVASGRAPTTPGSVSTARWRRRFVERDPARAFLYQQLNTFHSPPMAAIAGALTRPGIAARGDRRARHPDPRDHQHRRHAVPGRAGDRQHGAARERDDRRDRRRGPLRRTSSGPTSTTPSCCASSRTVRTSGCSARRHLVGEGRGRGRARPNHCSPRRRSRRSGDRVSVTQPSATRSSSTIGARKRSWMSIVNSWRGSS